MTSSSGQYKFDNYTEKLDEVGLVDNENNPVNTGNIKWHATASANGTSSSAGSGGGFIRVVFLLMLVFVILLQIIVVGLVAYSLTQSTTECTCTTTGSNTGANTGTEQPSTASGTCDTTAIQSGMSEIQKSISEIQSKINQVVQVADSGTNNILQVLQSKQDADTDFQTNATEMMSSTGDSLERIVNTLANQRERGISTASVVDNILIGVDELLVVHNTSSLYDSITPVSCKDIKAKLPDSPSGFYHVNNRDIYCNMDVLCNSTGGWTRLGYLDMTDSTENCPDGFSYLVYNGVRMCGRPNSNTGSCSSPVKFPSNGITYTEICGRVTGYERGTPNGITSHQAPIDTHNDINSHYVDGVSITKGSPREHVWTFVAGLSQGAYNGYNCPCNTPPGANQHVQSWVGTNYFCESGNPNANWPQDKVYTADPLWDGKQCGGMETGCCSDVGGPPWFHRVFNETTDSLDLRVCGDETTTNEDSPIAFYEVFVK